MIEEFICPACNTVIELQVRRWNTEEICPNCKQELKIIFDFQEMQDQKDEWDFWTIKIKS